LPSYETKPMIHHKGFCQPQEITEIAEGVKRFNLTQHAEAEPRPGMRGERTHVAVRLVLYSLSPQAGSVDDLLKFTMGITI